MDAAALAALYKMCPNTTMPESHVGRKNDLQLCVYTEQITNLQTDSASMTLSFTVRANGECSSLVLQTPPHDRLPGTDTILGVHQR